MKAMTTRTVQYGPLNLVRNRNITYIQSSNSPKTIYEAGGAAWMMIQSGARGMYV